jgi:hypothetical protein
MRVERQDKATPLPHPRTIEQLAHNGLVRQVYAVKASHRDDRILVADNLFK